MSKSATVLPELTPNSLKPKRGNPNWVKGGPSPNPGGKDKTYFDYRNMMKELFPEALAVIQKHLKSENEEVASRAAKLVTVYTLGKEPEPADVQHADAIRARLTTLVGVVAAPSLPSPVALPPAVLPPPTPVVVRAEPVPLLTSAPVVRTRQMTFRVAQGPVPEDVGPSTTS